MAIYQYRIQVIPEKSVLVKYGSIPEKLYINRKGWSEFHNSQEYYDAMDAFINNDVDIDIKPDFEDAYTFNWWENIKIDKTELVYTIDNLISRRYSPSEHEGWISWKSENEDIEDHDAYLEFDENNYIKKFSFRTDIRHKTNRFISNIVKICKKHDLLLMDDSTGILSKPDFKDINMNVMKSDAGRFITDPHKFLDELNLEDFN